MRGRIPVGLASLSDQAWLSLLNLAISLAFIRFASKEDYGVYLMLLTPLFLVQGIQNALILSPVATVLPSAKTSERGLTHDTAVASLTAFVLVAGVLSGIALTIYEWTAQNTLQPLLIIGFSLTAAGVCAREGARTLFYTRGMAVAAFRSDLVYGLGLLTGIGALCYFAALSTENALLATGFAALWTYAFRLRFLGELKVDLAVLRKFWAVADINGARLFLMPVGLAITAWSNVFRPRISAWAAEGRQSEIEKLSLRSIKLGLVILGIAAGLLLPAYPLVEPHLGGEYHGLLPLVILWTVFFALNLVRCVLMATLMTTPDGYKSLQAASCVALVIALPGLTLLSQFGAVWVLSVVIAVEAMQLMMIRSAAIRRWKEAAVER